MLPSLPQLSGDRMFLTDGGLETSMIFHRGLDLPLFASYKLLEDGQGRAALRDYFSRYLELARERGAGMVSAITMTYAEEAIGIARAASAAGIPVAISFTVETDGRLPSGQALGDAIEQVDAATGGAAVYHRGNFPHPP